MKKYTLCIAALLAVVLLASPAQALEYSVEAAAQADFGRPTSDETVYVDLEYPNESVDRSKNSALIPPTFGSATSYLPGTGEPLTPNLAADTGGASSPSGGGWTVIGGAGATDPSGGNTGTGSDFIISGSTSYPATAFTALTSKMYYSGGHIGTLKIPAIGLAVKIYEGTGSSPLSKGAGHFTDTSIWDGNVCLAGHNRGVTNHFGKIHTLDIGDTITLTTKLGTRSYEVISVAQVSETDRSGLAATSDNRVTLYTCVRDQRDLRWCIQAVEK
ncbi:class D sortase [Pseudoflavonifractor phocaeensis]|uniref:class D sortase n=1 Tax=Pseudoflavonifractor phocaeensis TaxID=1870988 RepID=UPI00210C3382|nr:sortase [Pseudoflavonifractor phocaeensis]MCQ4866161.1 class D sortase [Pseudoflavonifractor phocaeensis]